VPRILSTVLVLGLLAGTAAAFALTEGLKLEKTPIYATEVDKVFSPVCGCGTRRARIFFRLRKAERVRVTIEHDGHGVRTLVHGRHRQGPFDVFWDGRDDSGHVEPDGSYRPVVRLERSHRTIRLPNLIVIDTRPPVVEHVAVSPRIFSPDGDGRADRIDLRYRFDEHAHPVLFVDGKRRVVGRSSKESGSVDWFGRVRGRPVERGLHELSLAARDVAGNLGKRKSAGEVLVRYVSLGRETIRVTAAGRLAVRVSTDAATVRWRLAGRTGTAPRGTIRLRAPLVPGRYTLFVAANGRATKAAVVVRQPR
jgi:FlgD Ig-like domain